MSAKKRAKSLVGSNWPSLSFDEYETDVRSILAALNAGRGVVVAMMVVLLLRLLLAVVGHGCSRRCRGRHGRARRVVELLSLGPGGRVVQALAAVQLRLVLLLPLHAPVLEPDLDLALRQAQRVGDLDPSPAGQVSVEVELLLKLQGLVAGVRRSLALRLTILIDSI